ncbi:uncharacterized protein LOC113591575 isoform X5 [Electrophorus electricus]|uniref:uncharacterized protein LOC113591575 isoform X5 n=1 Tax=Electrophorus electricus TaxID=8005 RepID=UPI0015D025F9|nr:uncharacterized protein LOC113591575 isoform X5 [Electrophorus electricus]
MEGCSEQRGEFLLELHLLCDSDASCTKSVGTDLSMEDIGNLQTEVCELRKVIAVLERKLNQNPEKLSKEDVPTWSSVYKTELNCTETQDSDHSGEDQHIPQDMENVPNQSPVCKTEPNPTVTLEPDCNTLNLHTLQNMEDEPSQSSVCGPEQASVAALESVCDHENQSTLQEDVPSLSLHCYSDPNPTESLDSDCDGGDQHTMQSPLKTCSVRLVDCRKILELNGNIIAQRDQSGGDDAECAGDDDDDDEGDCGDGDDDGDDFVPSAECHGVGVRYWALKE